MKQQRNTKQRQIVLDAVKTRRDHPSADQVYLDARQADDKISRGTVYRNLNHLAEDGEILQVKLPDVSRFDWRTDLHYHLICTECGAVCDAVLPYHGELDHQLGADTGFVINRHRTVFEGVCPKCQKNRAD